MPNMMFEKSEKQNNILSVSDLDFENFSGLVPVIAQEHVSGRVLMLAYANLEAVRKTQETGYAHYWSRSRNKLWKKGESSGHVQRIIEVLVDCDEDALLYKVSQTGPACHTGVQSCFFRKLQTETS
tara:strand:- start:43 stop:420 length:378 start_codon:yes stop_codon:yes gene_type:complete